MSKSSQLTLPQVRAAFGLIQECCDLGADPIAWRIHLLNGMTAQLGCKLAIGGRADLHPTFDREAMIRNFGDVGWATPAERAPYAEWIARGTVVENPVSARIAVSQMTRITATRRELIQDGEWYRSPWYQALADAAQVNDVVFSFKLLGRSRYLLLVGHRQIKDRPFSSRDRTLLQLVSDEVEANLGKRLATFDEPSILELPPRLRQVLRHLLVGDTTKQAAARLNISTHTLHEHVKRLHRHFRVSSRGELMARCRGLLPVLTSASHLLP